MKFILRVFWNGLWRIRTKGKPKFYNRVKWFRQDNVSFQKARQALWLEKVEPLRQRLNVEGVHGKKRSRILMRKKRQITLALREHIGYKRYYEDFPSKDVNL